MIFREITYQVSSKLENIGLIGEAIRASCLLSEWEEREARRIELSVVEALNNVVEHAYEYDARGMIWVDLRLTDNDCRVVIRDRGNPRPKDLSHALEFNPDVLSELPEGGMGLHIIYRVMDSVLCDRVEGQNRMILIKTVEPANAL